MTVHELIELVRRSVHTCISYIIVY